MNTSIDYKSLIKHIELHTKNGYDPGSTDSLAYLGGKISDIFRLNRQGEYHGLSIELMENVKPLLTNNLIIRILKMLEQEDYNTPLNILGLTEIDQLIYIIRSWLQLALKEPHTQMKLFVSKKSYPKFDKWLTTYRFDPINAKFKIIEIGMNKDTGQPVVPSEWIDRIFDSGREAHLAMNDLESRLGKPPVTYAFIYSMQIVKNDGLIKNIDDISKKSYQSNIQFIFDGEKFNIDYNQKINRKLSYIAYNDTIIGFNLNEILKEKTTDKTNREVGVLISRMQKAIRRGRYARLTLEETIELLNISANYNLPEHNFMRVSAAKQLVWRLFISIMEDCRPYQAIDELGLLDLILLTLICNKLTEYQFTPAVLKLIKKTAINAQFNDHTTDLFEWRSLPISNNIKINLDSEYHTSIALAIKYLPMMGSDRQMLSKLYSATELFEPFISPMEKYTDKKINTDTILSSYDHHCKTAIILYYQGCINDMTTKETSSYIWNISSSYNVRSNIKLKSDPVLKSIQQYFFDGLDKTCQKKVKKISHDKFADIIVSNYIKRKVFIILFGQTYKYGKNEVVIAGTPSEPIRIKERDEWIYSLDEKILNTFGEKIINLREITPPDGFTWTTDSCTVSIKKGKPYIDNIAVKFFDGSSVIKSAVPIIKSNIKSSIQNIINDIFNGVEISFDDVKKFRSESVDKYYNWSIPSTAIMDLVYLTYTKIFNQLSNLIMIGPVDRLGHKMANSISYEHEGRLWVIFNMLSYLYPDTIIPNGLTNFKINTMTPGYHDLVLKLRSHIFVNKNISGTVPSIKTTLWDHQTDSVNKIISGFKSGGHGFGDASDVGAGKTLTALSIATKLIDTSDSESNYGILVLVPSNQLIKTWCDEIKKHTDGFELIVQENTNKIKKIKRNTIIISTMGRARDHPINHTWLLVIIDECLSVQNKNALQTEAAWKQSLLSKYLVMMSATFFRARFDKLYYMLKMLQTNLPENKTYLNAILLESIVSQVSSIKRKWTTNFNYFNLDSESKKSYDKIANSDLSDETLYAKLQAFLTNNKNVKKIITKNIKSIIDRVPSHRYLIYAKSNEEAAEWSAELDIPIYPEKGDHCIVTYHNGAYGLNDLVIYNAIIMRPPAPDLLPQIKGRLDRPGNKSNNLLIEYFVVKDTIDEGLIIRLNIASQFIQKYIMPLAKFYKISLNANEYKE